MRFRPVVVASGALALVASCVPPTLDYDAHGRDAGTGGGSGRDASAGDASSGGNSGGASSEGSGVGGSPGGADTGDTTSTGGADTGGTTSTGGAIGSTGGTATTGGRTGTGGNVATGGKPATGGTPGTGGKPATGGSPGTGGTGDASVGNIPVTGLALWLRADRGVTESNGTVSLWADQSGAHMDATQDQASLKPTLVSNGINGQPSILFDGVDDALQVAQGFSDFSAGVSFFTVVDANTTNVCAGIFEASNGREIEDISFDVDFGKFNFEVYNSSDETVVFPSGTPEQFTALQRPEGDTVEIRRNGLVGVVTDFQLPDVVTRKAVYVGNTLYMDCGAFSGNIGEIILYNRALTDSEVLTVEAYLSTKYGCCKEP
jgi:hypothetical protein